MGVVRHIHNDVTVATYIVLEGVVVMVEGWAGHDTAREGRGR